MNQRTIKDLNITKIKKRDDLPCRKYHEPKCMVCRSPLTKFKHFVCSPKCQLKWYYGIVFIHTDWKIPVTNSNLYFQDLNIQSKRMTA